MKREVIRVEPLSTYLERWKAPTSAVTRHGDTIYVSGFPPFDPKTGEVAVAPIERQTGARARAIEALRRDRRLVVGTGAEVQRLLHFGRQVRRRQRDLRPLFPEGPAGAHLHQRPRLAGVI
jgi:hypothetical protein